jgi:hypothetical protein
MQLRITILERNAIIMKDKLIIIGASGHGKVVADIAIKMNKWQSRRRNKNSNQIKFPN